MKASAVLAVVAATMIFSMAVPRPEPVPVLDKVLRTSPAAPTTANDTISPPLPVEKNMVATYVASTKHIPGVKVLTESLLRQDGSALPYDLIALPSPILGAKGEAELGGLGWRVVQVRDVRHPFPDECETGGTCYDFAMYHVFKMPYTKGVFISPEMIAKAPVAPLFESIVAHKVLAAFDCSAGASISTAVFGFVPDTLEAHKMFMGIAKIRDRAQATVKGFFNSFFAGRLIELPRQSNCDATCFTIDVEANQISDYRATCELVYSPMSCVDV